jgi:putative ABC transport system permease protein
VLAISWQTLRARRGSLAGAFIAIWLAVTLGYATAQLMAGALGGFGPGRFTAASHVLRAHASVTYGQGEDAEHVAVIPPPRLPASAVARAAAVPGVQRAVGDVTFPVGAWHHGQAVRADLLRGHGWASAALTPFRLTAGRPPAGPREVVADAGLGVHVGDALRVVAPGGDGAYRVVGVAAAADADLESPLFFSAPTAGRLSGAPGSVNAIGIIGPASADALRAPGVDVLAPAHAGEADAGDPEAKSRADLIPIFGTMGGIAGMVALFVVAGTFALAIAQRRRETAVLRALGATPRQVRRVIAGEALIVSLLAGALGVLAGTPLAGAIARELVDREVAPLGFAPGSSWLPLVIAVGGGVLVSQLAVIAAAWRAGRVPPADALREASIEHGRPGILRLLAGVAALGGGVAMAIIFTGEQALAFAIITGFLLATGTVLLGRWLVGLPAAAVALPLRALGAAGLLAGTGLAANRWRTAALAGPIVLIAMLVGTMGVLQGSAQRNVETVGAQRISAGHVVVGRDGAPLPAGTARQVAQLDGVRAATALLPTEVYLLDQGLGWDTPWAAAGLAGTGALDLDVTAGRLADVGGDTVAVSRVVAAEGHVGVGDVLHVRMADTRPATLRIAAIYDRSAGLGDVVLDPAVARRHAAERADTAVFVSGGARALDGYARAHPGVRALTRTQYLRTLHAAANQDSWAIWLIVGLSVGFATLALLNTAAMATSERREELATIRLLGGSAWQATRMVALELAVVLLAAVAAGAAVAGIAIHGVPDGVRGIPLVIPPELAAGLPAGAALLGLLAAAVTARLALRATPATALRVNE